MDIKSIKRDPKKIDDGQWVSDIPDMGDLRLKVRGMSAVTVRDTRSKLERAVPKEHRRRDGSLTAAAGMSVLGQTAFEAILQDWDGLTEDGKPIPYTRALAKEWLTNPEFEAFLDAVVWAANVVDRGQADLTEEVAEN